MRLIAGFCFICLFASAAHANENDSSTNANDEGWIREWLLLEPTGKGGRVPFPVDTLAHQLADGTYELPRADKIVFSVDGKQRTWRTTQSNNDGWLISPALRGGHAAAIVTVNEDTTKVLEAVGHNMAYCNGRPRAGDPYGFGVVRLPIQLRKGDNHLLFRVSRGRVRARLVAPKNEAQLNVDDVTMPDSVAGERCDLIGAVVVMNNSSKPLRDMWIAAKVDGGESVRSTIPLIGARTVRKVPFQIRVPTDSLPQRTTLDLELSRGDVTDAYLLDRATLPFAIRAPDEVYKKTFVSQIDGSVQYYAVRRASEPGEDKALFLTLHGASVEALGQARAYRAKTWGHIVAPTNRRPYGFDWEDWGRWDALEVLGDAGQSFAVDRTRIYLTGHSMGGHGTWHIGATFPDRFAAIAPSAGWISFASYTGARPFDESDPMACMLNRAVAASDTLSLSKNLTDLGVYVLHGTADDNVPVAQAREMRDVLGKFHGDFAYYEREGAGHWWGNQCVDWPQLFDFFQHRRRPQVQDVDSVRFHTISPGVSARADWVAIEMQQQPFVPSLVEFTLDRATRTIAGRTENVSRLAFRLDDMVSNVAGEKTSAFAANQSLTIVIDDQEFADVTWPQSGHLHLHRHAENWSVGAAAPSGWKGPHRYGPFKNAFRNRAVFVYGTGGNESENDWSYSKARFDAETFWYRGNGSFELISDVDYDPSSYRGRNVILYGNADTNRAWPMLLADCPVRVVRGSISVGESSWNGDDLAAFFVYPIPDDELALVGVISGTGLPGMKATNTLPYFVSGVGYPDCTLFRVSALRNGIDGVVYAGFFGAQWDIEGGEFVAKDSYVPIP